ncbi:hypothetical protein GOV13_05320 [Candidatus Pacearchaeota archaeon]|nr:hypothetical protein [Candidatus Pacearchaeota archaeon]
MSNKKNKGVSPVIATVLLIAMVLASGVVVFIWFNQMTTESITKFGGTNVELVCDEVRFDASYDGGVLSLSNNGNVPIFGMKVKIVDKGSHKTEDLKTLNPANWPPTGLNQGGIFSGSIGITGDSIVLTPVLMGTSDKGKRTFVCDERRYGYELTA